MLEIVKTLLSTQLAPEVYTLLVNSGQSSTEALELIQEALKPEVDRNEDGKVKMEKIVLIWAEGWYHQEDVSFTSWDKFNATLREISHNQCGQGYDKVKFQIVWADGEEYTGRCDVQADGTDTNIGEHVLEFLNYLIVSPAEDGNGCQEFINTYEIIV